MSDDDLNVDSAYNLKTPDDNKKLYRAWAETYDATFAVAKDYLFPQHIARTFARRAGCGPVFDAGAGTGLVAEAITQNGAQEIDAFDLSVDMLEVARRKGLYRNLFAGDLTKTLPFGTASYAAVVSSGTFTHGHVGPEAIDELMRIAAPDALFVLSIKTELFEGMGFKAKFDGLCDQIQGFELEELPVYGAGADPDHADDTGLVVSFRRA